MTVHCRICNCEVDPHDTDFIPGFGRLCDDCEERTELEMDATGRFKAAHVAPEDQKA